MPVRRAVWLCSVIFLLPSSHRTINFLRQRGHFRCCGLPTGMKAAAFFFFFPCFSGAKKASQIDFRFVLCNLFLDYGLILEKLRTVIAYL